MLQTVKCACPTCQCQIDSAKAPTKAVMRDGKVFCSQACAYECTETTCVCVHENCDDHGAADHKHE